MERGSSNIKENTNYPITAALCLVLDDKFIDWRYNAKGFKKSLKSLILNQRNSKVFWEELPRGEYQELKEKKVESKRKSNGRLYISEKAMDNYCKSIVEHEKNKASEKEKRRTKLARQ